MFEFDSITGSVGWEGCVAAIGRSSVGGETAQVTGDSKMMARASHSPEPLVGRSSNSKLICSMLLVYLLRYKDVRTLVEVAVAICVCDIHVCVVQAGDVTDPSVPSKEDIPTFDEWKKQVMEVEMEKSKCLKY